jgi:hypothetical protein
LTKNFLSPSKKNFAAGRIREFAVLVMLSEVETSLNSMLSLFRVRDSSTSLGMTKAK